MKKPKVIKWPKKLSTAQHRLRVNVLWGHARELSDTLELHWTEVSQCSSVGDLHKTMWIKNFSKRHHLACHHVATCISKYF